MTNVKAILGLLVASVAAVAAVAVLGAAQASASQASLVITYEKTCNAAGNHCLGTTGDGDELEMLVTGFRQTGEAAQLTMTEWIRGPGGAPLKLTAELNGHASPGFHFVVLNGTVTEGPFAGAEVHQRSDLTGPAGAGTAWTGQLRIMSASS